MKTNNTKEPEKIEPVTLLGFIKTIKKYNIQIDRKWQKRWRDFNLYKFKKNKLDKKIYCLEMFSYPSGAQLHIGHWYNYGLTDIWARYKRLQGYNVLNPQGFDSFGLPAENYAIKTGIHPKDSTYKNIDTMRRQLKEMGTTADWDYEIITSDPEYYRWTQWFFIQMYKKGLAYRKNASVNWCDKCKTVLANEQVVDGYCERCGTEIYLKQLTQWFLKITAYAQELYDSVDSLDWPEETKKIQKNWIGPSRGALIDFVIINNNKTFSLKAFTTRPDTLFGLSYVVIAPEHEMISSLLTSEHQDNAKKYIENVMKKSEIDRMSTEREITGVFTGSYAINPINKEKVPVWIADYVIASYGTGFVMAVPAHDERDFKFAIKYSLPIKKVVDSINAKKTDLPFCEYGTSVNSKEFTGLKSKEAGNNIVMKLKKDGKAKFKTTFRLRDWLVSRQRYWGTPIPIIYCKKCGVVPVQEKDLPIVLPYEVEFKPTGESPLLECDDFINVKCPVCNANARRETDTLDTFVDSSWYFLRYPDSKNDKEPFNKNLINEILPVDKYVGGREHASMHLIYARFFTKVLNDLGYVNFREPFPSLLHQGVINSSNGLKMSKSKGNVISPDDYVLKYGSDVLRLYLSFGFSYVDGGPWSDEGIEAIRKFVEKIEEFFTNTSKDSIKNSQHLDYSIAEKKLDYIRNFAIKAISRDVEQFKFNTCIARLMEFLTALNIYIRGNVNKKFLNSCLNDFTILLSPFAPHFAEEIWEFLGNDFSVFNQTWPNYDEALLIKEEIELVVQINGKLRARIVVPYNLSKEELIKKALDAELVQKWLEGKEIKKKIIISNKLINIVV